MLKEPKSIRLLNKYYISMIVLIIFIFLLLRLYIIFILPNADDSIYMYKTYLMTEGWKIYKDFGDNRMPGFYMMLYPFMYLYKTVSQLPYENVIYFGRAFSYMASIISMVYIFKIGKYIKNDVVGLTAGALFLISPYGISFNTHIFLENFLTTFSLIGFYAFFSGTRNDEEKDLFLAGIFFGLAILIKQQAILLFPVVILMLLLKSMRRFQIGKFLHGVSILSLGGLMIGIVTLIYFIYQGTLDNFLYAMSTSIEQSYMWSSPTQEKMIRDYIMPMIGANELFTLIFGFSGIMFCLITFFRNSDFELKTLSLWFISYIMIVYTISNNYMQYYIPMLPILVIISACMIDNFIKFLNRNHKNILIVLIFTILATDLYHLNFQYQNFIQYPIKKVIVTVPPLDGHISVAKYLYEHTEDKDMIFSVDPIYSLISGRYNANYFSSSKFPTTEELIVVLNDNRTKYAVIDDTTTFQLKNKWKGVLEYIQQNFQMEKEFTIIRSTDNRKAIISLYRRK